MPSLSAHTPQGGTRPSSRQTGPSLSWVPIAGPSRPYLDLGSTDLEPGGLVRPLLYGLEESLHVSGPGGGGVESLLASVSRLWIFLAWFTPQPGLGLSS